MSDHVGAERLDEYADGLLDARARAAVEAHLATCAECRGEVEGARALAARAAALPRRIEPRDDLWPAVRDAVRASGASHEAPSHRLLASGWWRAAAAVLLVAASSAVTALVLRRPAPGGPMPVAMPARVARLETGYEATTRALETELDARRASLAPATIAAITRSLAVIDSAIAEARAALAHDPGNASLEQLLNASYEHKVEVLARAARLSTGT